MAGLARAGVDEAGVEPVGPRQRQRQALAVLRRQDEVNVVRRLAIGLETSTSKLGQDSASQSR